MAGAGKPVPGLAPAAKQQGHYVAQVIRTAISNRPSPPPFRYKHYGNLATIGRLSAVAELSPLRLWGRAPHGGSGASPTILFLGGGSQPCGGRSQLVVGLCHVSP